MIRLCQFALIRRIRVISLLFSIQLPAAFAALATYPRFFAALATCPRLSPRWLPQAFRLSSALDDKTLRDWP